VIQGIGYVEKEKTNEKRKDRVKNISSTESNPESKDFTCC
jgi:hypothetical protein